MIFYAPGRMANLIFPEAVLPERAASFFMSPAPNPFSGNFRHPSAVRLFLTKPGQVE
jgi:hypothetical protein